MRIVRSWRARLGCAAVAVVTTSTLLVAGTAEAATPVPINQAALNEALFGQVVEIHISGPDLIKTAALSAEFIEWRRLHPNAPAAEAQAQLAARKQLLDGALTPFDLRQPEQDLLLRCIDILLATPGGDTRTSPEIVALVAAVIGRTVEPWDTREELASGALRHAQWLRGRTEALATVFSVVRRRAANNAAFATAWNAVLGTPFGVNAAATQAELKADPGLSHVDLDEILALSGDAVAFTAKAKEQIAAVHLDLLGLTVGIRLEIGNNNAKCPPEGPPSAECTKAEREAAAARDKSRQETITDLKAGLTMVSRLIKFADPDIGNKVQVIGDAVANTASAISKYAAAIAGRGLADAIFSTATIGMTGNVFGAVMSVVGLFGSGGPSLDQQILSQVQALRDEVRALGAEMRASFARVEAQINTVYANMMAQFDRLNAAIAGNTAQLTAVQQQIAQLGLRLEDIAATVLAAIGDATLHDTRADINQYIGYLENFGRTIPTFDEFLNPENQFHLAATVLAKGSAFVVPKGDADNPAVDPTNVLNSFGEARAINYLARLANKRDASIPDPATPVGNPGVWNLGAQSYSMLMLQNPGYAAQVNTARAAQIEAEGARILDTAASFSRPTNGHVNNLLTSLLNDYSAATNQLSAELRFFRTSEVLVRWEPDPDGVQRKVSKNYDLFWDTNKTLAAMPVPGDPPQIPLCGGTTKPIARPTNMSNVLLSNPVRMINYAYAPRIDAPPAGVRELPQLGACYTPSWLVTRTEDSGGVLRTFGRLRLTVHSQFRMNPASAWQNARTGVYVWPEEQAIATHCQQFQCDWQKTPEEGLAEVWPGDRTRFQTGATITTNTALDAQLTTTLRKFLQTRQQWMYDQVQDKFAVASTPIGAATKRMNTAARLLQAYTRLGMPLALDSDDVLSSKLFGQYQIPVNMPTDPKLANAYGIAAGNYCTTSAPCPLDASRPLRNQVSVKLPCEVTPGGTNLPGDPLGDCLVASAHARVLVLWSRYEIWSQQLAAGTHREQLSWGADTLAGLRITTRLTHAA